MTASPTALRSVPQIYDLHDDLDYSQLDSLIRPFVATLRYHGVRTVMSCQGGEGHPDRFPWITFAGTDQDARHVTGIVDYYSWSVTGLDRCFSICEGLIEHKGWKLNLLPLQECDADDARTRLDHARRHLARAPRPSTNDSVATLSVAQWL